MCKLLACWCEVHEDSKYFHESRCIAVKRANNEVAVAVFSIPVIHVRHRLLCCHNFLMQMHWELQLETMLA